MPTVADLGQQIKQQYPGAYDAMPDAQVGSMAKAKSPGQFAMYADSDPSTGAPSTGAPSAGAPAAGAPAAPGVIPSGAPSGSQEGWLSRIGADLSIGFRSGASDIAHTASNLGRSLGIDSLAQWAQQKEQALAPTPEETAGKNALVDKLIQGVGAAPPTIVKYLPAELSGKWAPLTAGAIGALSASDKGSDEAITQGIRDAATFGLMGQAAKLPTRVQRTVGQAAAAAGTGAAFGDKPEDIAANALMGGAFGAITKDENAATPENIKETLDSGVGAVNKLGDGFRKIFSPQTRGPKAADAARIVRANVAEVARQSDQASAALQEASKATALMPDEQRLAVINAIETGTPQTDVAWKSMFGPKSIEAEKMQGFVDQMRAIHNDVRDKLIETASRPDPETGELKPTALKSVKEALQGDDEALKNYYENYFPHLFTDPEKAGDVMRAYYAGKAPLRGPATFLKQRTYPTIAEALSVVDPETGTPALKLVTTDPVEAFMLKWREMERFTAAQRIIKESAESGLLQWQPPNKRGPQGWVRIDDPSFKRFQSTPDGKELSGQAWMPEPAARVIANYLTPGLRTNAAFRGLLTANNILNQAQLGLSGFHFGMTSINVVTSKFALGLEQAVEGLRSQDAGLVGKGVINLAKGTPIGAIPTVVENMRLGRKMAQEWMKPGSSEDPQTANLVGLMQEAGGRLSLDPVYRTNMKQRVMETLRTQQGLWKNIYQLPLAVNESFANLLMNKFVPWQKLGVFGDLARFEMAKLPEDAPRAQVRQVMQQAWDSVDNRMGQLVYDNLFWNKTAKDLLMGTVRSVGWNLGTLRELGGSVGDTTAALKNGLAGKNASFTHKMAYAVALPVVTGMMGGMIHYAYTGQQPQEPIDYWFPKTGRKDEFGRDERISLPSYMKDIFHVYQATQDIADGAGTGRALGLVAGKLHSSWGVIADMLQNRDFYNTQIANPEDPLYKRALDYIGYAGAQAEPFSMTNLMRERKLGMPTSEQIGTMVGFTPAPSYLKKTVAERVATDLMSAGLPQRANTKEERERQDTRRGIERQMRLGEDWATPARKALTEGALSEDDIWSAADRARGLPLDRTFLRMRLMDLPKVWDVANAEEKQRLLPVLVQRLGNAGNSIEKLPEKERAPLIEKLRQMIHEPIPAAPPVPAGMTQSAAAGGR